MRLQIARIDGPEYVSFSIVELGAFTGSRLPDGLKLDGKRQENSFRDFITQ